MKNWLIIALVVVIVAAGAFLPELLVKWVGEPEVDMDDQQVSVTSQSSSDYTWRMDRLGEYLYGEGENLLSTYISQAEGEEAAQAYAQLRSEVEELVHLGVIPEDAEQLLTEDADYTIRYYYMFDNNAVSGFRYADFLAASTNWRIRIYMDVESGKLARVEYGGSRVFPGGEAMPERSWYDVLRGFGQYLGLSDTPAPVLTPEVQGARAYYESITADRRTATVADGTSWLELRALRERYTAVVTVYRGGK